MTDYRLFKRKGSSKWYVWFQDHREEEHRLALAKNKDDARDLAKTIVQIVADRRARKTIDRDKLAELPNRLQKALLRKGVVDSTDDAAGKPLADHLADYKSALQAKGNMPNYVRMTESRIGRIIDGCRFTYWRDVKASAVHRYIADVRVNRSKSENPTAKPATAKTKNEYLFAFKGFCRWAVKDRRLAESPVDHLQRWSAEKVNNSRRHERRALTIDEGRKLLAAALAGDVCENGAEAVKHFYRMTGEDRYWLYRLALETGLRANELRSLTASSFNLSGDEPTVTVNSTHTKNRRKAIVPLRAETATELRNYLSHKAPAAPMFKMPATHQVIGMLRADLRAAGVVYRLDDEKGHVADFHSLRHTCGSWLAAQGVHPKVIQRIMRHSTITLTMDKYTHAFKADESAAVAKLPDLSTPQRETQSKTGTDAADDAPKSNRETVRQTVRFSEDSAKHTMERIGTGAIGNADISASKRIEKGDQRDLNPQPPRPQRGALPIELWSPSAWPDKLPGPVHCIQSKIRLGPGACQTLYSYEDAPPWTTRSGLKPKALRATLTD